MSKDRLPISSRDDKVTASRVDGGSHGKMCSAMSSAGSAGICTIHKPIVSNDEAQKRWRQRSQHQNFVILLIYSVVSCQVAFKFRFVK